MAETLDDIMVDSATSTAPEVPETTEAAESVESETTSQPETEAETSEQTKEVETKEETGETSKDDPWTKTAYLDEKRKRQDYATKLEEANRKIAELEGKGEKAERPDVIDDPDGFSDSLEQNLDNKLLKQKIDMSRVMSMKAHEDYEQMEAAFIDIAKENPTLVQQMNQSAHPAEFVYETARQHLEFKDFKSGDLKAKMMAEIRAELKAELVSEQSEKSEKTANLSKSLINQSSASGSDSVSAKTIDDIL